MRALVIGGTRGIGAAIADRLASGAWNVVATGRADFDIGNPDTWQTWAQGLGGAPIFDLVVFSAGVLEPLQWAHKSFAEYMRSYAVHAGGPIAFLARFKSWFPWWSRVVFISTVGATNAGSVDLSYGMSKAALEKAARALEEAEAWKVTCVRLDLVDTAMLYKLPVESLHGRPVMSKKEAAEFVLNEAGI